MWLSFPTYIFHVDRMGKRSPAFQETWSWRAKALEKSKTKNLRMKVSEVTAVGVLIPEITRANSSLLWWFNPALLGYAVQPSSAPNLFFIIFYPDRLVQWMFSTGVNSWLGRKSMVEWSSFPSTLGFLPGSYFLFGSEMHNMWIVLRCL